PVQPADVAGRLVQSQALGLHGEQLALGHALDELLLAARGQTAELAAEIEKQIKDYEELLKTPAKELRIHSLNDLRVAPIRYRIAARMTVESFARLVHVHSRQIARYESEDYQNVSWDTLLKILERLNVKIEGTVELDRKIAV
ncbi:MAG: helix-turn-helix transcriptional regulator, partial [Nitrospirae bacterium]|nr:helix-turn-helix transcriptional regulator [Nitrospirota bacterium]